MGVIADDRISAEAVAAAHEAGITEDQALKFLSALGEKNLADESCLAFFMCEREPGHEAPTYGTYAKSFLRVLATGRGLTG